MFLTVYINSVGKYISVTHSGSTEVIASTKSCGEEVFTIEGGFTQQLRAKALDKARRLGIDFVKNLDD